MRPILLAALVAIGALTGCSVATATPSSDSTDEPLIHAPPDPNAPASTSTDSRTFVVQSLDLGGATNDGWTTLGLDIDGQATTRYSTGVCQLAPGAAQVAQTDGAGGIDNSFGENLLPILITVLGSDLPDRLNASFASGAVNQFEVFGLGPSMSDATVMANFDGAPFAGAWLTGGTLVGGPSAKEAQLLLGVATSNGYQAAELTFPMTHIQMVAPLADDGSSVQGGVLSAIIPTSEALTALDRFARALDPNIEESSLASLEQQVGQASDIMVDGTQDPSKPCDGISLGLGFTAAVGAPPRVLHPSARSTAPFVLAH